MASSLARARRRSVHEASRATGGGKGVQGVQEEYYVSAQNEHNQGRLRAVLGLGGYFRGLRGAKIDAELNTALNAPKEFFSFER